MSAFKYVRNRLGHQFTVGNLSCCTTSGVDGITDLWVLSASSRLSGVDRVKRFSALNQFCEEKAN